jgi:hypothetical protein
MLGISYRKASPTDYVLHFSRGRLTREGAGLSFFYFSPASSIASVPLASANIPFVFTEPTADFQTLTVQGQMTYRIVDPKKASAMLDFTLDAKGKYVSDQYQKLPERLVYGLQTLVRAEIQGLPLREALVHGDALTARVLDQLKASPEVVQLGVEILNLAVLSLKPTPEMAKALEAEARETLNRNADEPSIRGAMQPSSRSGGSRRMNSRPNCSSKPNSARSTNTRWRRKLRSKSNAPR